MPSSARTPHQLEAAGGQLIRGWTASPPRFYGEGTVPGLRDQIIEAESLLQESAAPVPPSLCRVLAAFHGTRGGKVPLTVASVTGCVRPAFVAANPWLTPSSPSCYDGHCYLYHARGVPAKRNGAPKVVANEAPVESLVEAARIARTFGVPLRDNQSSDGSLSLVLRTRDGSDGLIARNLRLLRDHGFGDVPYLCFSSAYVAVDDKALERLSDFGALTVQVTVSGWHSREENLLRLGEFDRYGGHIENIRLRFVNRLDWEGDGREADARAARCEGWLLEEIERRGWMNRVIRTPFHSTRAFPGSAVGTLGTRHMAGGDYGGHWPRSDGLGIQTCCTTGKCKNCPTRCGIEWREPRRPEPGLAARAFESMLLFELGRQSRAGGSPAGAYTARLLAKKAAAEFREAGDLDAAFQMEEEAARMDAFVKSLTLAPRERTRLTNDAHALVFDGLDYRKLWTGRDHDDPHGCEYSVSRRRDKPARGRRNQELEAM